MLSDSDSKYLSDPTEDVQVATENLMADFLREIRGIATANRQRREKERKARERNESPDGSKDVNLLNHDQSPSISASPERGSFMAAFDGQVVLNDEEPIHPSRRTDDNRDGGMYQSLRHLNHQLKGDV